MLMIKKNISYPMNNVTKRFFFKGHRVHFTCKLYHMLTNILNVLDIGIYKNDNVHNNFK